MENYPYAEPILPPPDTPVQTKETSSRPVDRLAIRVAAGLLFTTATHLGSPSGRSGSEASTGTLTPPLKTCHGCPGSAARKGGGGLGGGVAPDGGRTRRELVDESFEQIFDVPPHPLLVRRFSSIALQSRFSSIGLISELIDSVK